MNQETSSKANSPENRKRILLGILFIALIGVLYFQFFTSGEDRPAPATNPGTSGSSASGPSLATTGSQPVRQTKPPGKEAPIVTLPLDLVAVTNRLFGKGEPGSSSSGRNIFVYPTPTPPPPPKPEPPPPPIPPPPITLTSVTPSGVIARTGDFKFTVFGDKIPPDGQIQVGGRPLNTTVISTTEAQSLITADMIKSGGNLNITIRSSSDPSLYSGQVSINVADPPTPLYRYIGLIVTRKEKLAVVKELDDDQLMLNLIENMSFKCNKETKKCKWRLTDINPQRLIIEDLDLRITHTVNYTGESGDDKR